MHTWEEHRISWWPPPQLVVTSCCIADFWAQLEPPTHQVQAFLGPLNRYVIAETSFFSALQHWSCTIVLIGTCQSHIEPNWTFQVLWSSGFMPHWCFQSVGGLLDFISHCLARHRLNRWHSWVCTEWRCNTERTCWWCSPSLTDSVAFMTITEWISAIRWCSCLCCFPLFLCRTLSKLLCHHLDVLQYD